MSDDAKIARPGQHDEQADEVEGHGKIAAADDGDDDEVEAHGRLEGKLDGKLD